MNTCTEPAISIAALETGDIDPQLFDHEAHVYAGWLYLREFPLAEAIARFTAALQRLTARLGVPEKYHETVSWFFLLLIAERRALSATDGWSDFRSNNDDLFRRNNNVLARYYSDELVGSDLARRRFLLPDRLAS